MRFRLMAAYRGVPYEAGVGPSGSDVVLFAACPPPEELGFEPATGHWRKHVIRAEIDALWESRPVGVFRGEACIVLDDLGERLHVAYIGLDAERATELGYWQVDRGVFELLVPREEVNGLAEERVDVPPHWTGPSAEGEPGSPYETAPGVVSPDTAPGPTASGERADGAPPAGEGLAAGEGWQAQLAAAGRPHDRDEPLDAPHPEPPHPEPPHPEPPHPEPPHPEPPHPEPPHPEPPHPEPPHPEPPHPEPPAAGHHRPPAARLAPAVPGTGGRAARRERVPTQEIFCELADLAGIPRSAYALEAETDGAFCLIRGAEGFEVFLAAGGARHEARSFADEEAACFYLFGVLVAEAVRTGSLVAVPPAPSPPAKTGTPHWASHPV